jgi:hypothetical protein
MEKATGISLGRYAENKDFSIIEKLTLLLIAIGLSVAIVAILSQSINVSGTHITGSTATNGKLMTPEEYLNNCSNNYTFVSCPSNGSACTADGKPIQVTGYLDENP